MGTDERRDGEGPPSAEYRLADDVVAAIAAIAAGEVAGVAGLGGGIGLGLGEVLGKRPAARGVRALVGTREAVLDVYLHVAYGVQIPVVAQRVQENVKRAVESMTGLRVTEVNVHVQGLETPPSAAGRGGPRPPE